MMKLNVIYLLKRNHYNKTLLTIGLSTFFSETQLHTLLRNMLQQYIAEM